MDAATGSRSGRHLLMSEVWMSTSARFRWFVDRQHGWHGSALVHNQGAALWTQPLRHKGIVWTANLVLTDGASPQHPLTNQPWYGTHTRAFWLTRPCCMNAALAGSLQPDGKWVLTSSMARLGGDANSGEPVSQPMRHKDRLADALFSPDGRTVLTGSDGVARLWDARTGYP
jgi:WD40 repeat protein